MGRYGLICVSAPLFKGRGRQYLVESGYASAQADPAPGKKLPRSDRLVFLIGRDRLGLVFHTGGMPLQDVAEPALSPEPNVLFGAKTVGQAPRRQRHVIIGDDAILRQAALQPASFDQALGQVPVGA